MVGLRKPPGHHAQCPAPVPLARHEVMQELIDAQLGAGSHEDVRVRLATYGESYGPRGGHLDPAHRQRKRTGSCLRRRVLHQLPRQGVRPVLPPRSRHVVEFDVAPADHQLLTTFPRAVRPLSSDQASVQYMEPGASTADTRTTLGAAGLLPSLPARPSLALVTGTDPAAGAILRTGSTVVVDWRATPHPPTRAPPHQR